MFVCAVWCSIASQTLPFPRESCYIGVVTSSSVCMISQGFYGCEVGRPVVELYSALKLTVKIKLSNIVHAEAEEKAMAHKMSLWV